MNQSPWKHQRLSRKPQSVNKTKGQKQFTNRRAARFGCGWSRSDLDPRAAGTEGDAEESDKGHTLSGRC